MGIWVDIKPKKIKRKYRNKWFFAQYMEPPSQRDDGAWYECLLFRDKDYKIFGIIEFDSL